MSYFNYQPAFKDRLKFLMALKNNNEKDDYAMYIELFHTRAQSPAIFTTGCGEAASI
ncbi:MAG: hypothetical protein M5U10_10730 [Candidatus Methanoperedens sp.]|nr:hypothetical protein [Candidatus Methanoperedens nitroreducens]MDJ1422377.1 hypothetical protein [Candidatus Methanoperedens sp.]